MMVFDVMLYQQLVLHISISILTFHKRPLNTKLATQEKRVYNKNGLLWVVWGVLLLAA